MKVDISMPTEIAIKNIGNEVISFRYYGVNFAKKLDIDEEVIITGASSEATAFYLAQADENKCLQVKVNETNSEETTEPTNPETPIEPENPTEPTEPETPTEPTEPVNTDNP